MTRPGRFNPNKENRYPFYRKLNGLHSRYRRARGISPMQGFDPQTVQSIAKPMYILVYNPELKFCRYFVPNLRAIFTVTNMYAWGH